MMIKDKKKIYILGKHKYEVPPISKYYIDHIEYEEGVEYITIRWKIPTIIHALIITLMIGSSILFSYMFNNSISLNEKVKHTIKVPNEIYYDKETSTIDLDTTNSLDNNEDISITLRTEDNNKLIEFENIKPGYAIGAVPIDKEVTKLPNKCTLEYSIIKDGKVLEVIKINTLLVDREVSDRDVNNDF